MVGYTEGAEIEDRKPKIENPYLLVTDVDGTLTGDHQALRRFIETVKRTPRLLIALNSSRPLASQDQTLAAWEMDFTPDAMIGSMGTEVRVGRVGGEAVEAWTAGFGDWDRAVVDRVMAELGYEPHAPELQTRYKASFVVPAGDDQRRAQRALEETGMKVRIIASGVSDFDVIPPTGGKDRATRFLAEHLGVGADRLMVAGDSANDLAMFRACDRGIVVANARPELRDAVDPQRVYFARNPYAAGVLEGVRYWGALSSEAVDAADAIGGFSDKPSETETDS